MKNKKLHKVALLLKSKQKRKKNTHVKKPKKKYIYKYLLRVYLEFTCTIVNMWATTNQQMRRGEGEKSPLFVIVIVKNRKKIIKDLIFYTIEEVKLTFFFFLFF